MDQLPIGRTIIELRNSIHLSQLEFSNKMGIPQSTLSGIESGAIRPTTRMLFKISELADIPVDEIFSQAGRFYLENTVIAYLFRKESSRSKRKLERLLRLIDNREVTI